MLVHYTISEYICRKDGSFSSNLMKLLKIENCSTIGNRYYIDITPMPNVLFDSFWLKN